MRRGRLLVGTSGWLYPHWRDRFYPPRLPLKQQLPYLASQLPSVEINGTFYSLKRPPSFAAWRDGTPDDFVFAVKGSRYLTHMLKLREPRAPLANFFAQGVLLLGKKLGPILWQLPPMLGFDADRARAFFDLLPRDLAAAERLARRHDHRLDGRSALTAPDGHDRPLRHALEIRHSSWLDEPALTLLAEHGIALVTADSADHHPLSLERTAAAFAYVRLHGSAALYASRYRDDELDEWAALADLWRRRGSDVYVYFDNDAQAYAPEDARRLLERAEPCLGRSPVDART
ncbi:MAG TPA: DUF72 domain-containing protein [Polyangia bacterium]|nr:DUF72 domain-containing protein [Polyangia bacterium]